MLCEVPVLGSWSLQTLGLNWVALLLAQWSGCAPAAAAVCAWLGTLPAGCCMQGWVLGLHVWSPVTTHTHRAR
jgi:hypothetical protein